MKPLHEYPVVQLLYHREPFWKKALAYAHRRTGPTTVPTSQFPPAAGAEFIGPKLYWCGEYFHALWKPERDSDTMPVFDDVEAYADATEAKAVASVATRW